MAWSPMFPEPGGRDEHVPSGSATGALERRGHAPLGDSQVVGEPSGEEGPSEADVANDHSGPLR